VTEYIISGLHSSTPVHTVIHLATTVSTADAWHLLGLLHWLTN